MRTSVQSLHKFLLRKTFLYKSWLKLPALTPVGYSTVSRLLSYKIIRNLRQIYLLEILGIHLQKLFLLHYTVPLFECIMFDKCTTELVFNRKKILQRIKSFPDFYIWQNWRTTMGRGQIEACNWLLWIKYYWNPASVIILHVVDSC